MGTAPDSTTPDGTPPAGWVPSPQIRRWQEKHPDVTRMFPEDVAEVTGLRREYIHQLNYDAENSRRVGWPARPVDMPAPAGHQRRRSSVSPWWWPWDIDDWMTRRRVTRRGGRPRGRPPKVPAG